MKAILLLSVFLLAGLASAAADTPVTIEAKVPIEQLGPDGNVTGVSMATPGSHYTLVKPGPVGVDGQPEIIVSGATGDHYRIATAATDYRPAPAAGTDTNAAPSERPATASAPSSTQSTNSSLMDDDAVAKLISDSGLDKRLQRAVDLASQAKPRQLDPFDGTATQSFASGLKVETYANDYIAAARQAYGTFTSDDLASIAKFLADPIAKADQTYTPASPPLPGSIFDIQANARGDQLQQMEILGLNARSTIKRLGLAAATVAFVQGIPKNISDGELDGLAAGLYASPAYATRTAEIQSLLIQAKLMPARSAAEKATLDQINKENQQEGRPPFTDPIVIRKAEIDQATIPSMCVYASMLNPDQIQQWEVFANSSTGKKFYAFRIAVLASITSDLEKDWYTERYTAAKTWSQSSPDDAYAMLKSLASPPATPPATP